MGWARGGGRVFAWGGGFLSLPFPFGFIYSFNFKRKREPSPAGGVGGEGPPGITSPPCPLSHKGQRGGGVTGCKSGTAAGGTGPVAGRAGEAPAGRYRGPRRGCRAAGGECVCVGTSKAPLPQPSLRVIHTNRVIHTIIHRSPLRRGPAAHPRRVPPSSPLSPTPLPCRRGSAGLPEPPPAAAFLRGNEKPAVSASGGSTGGQRTRTRVCV